MFKRHWKKFIVVAALVIWALALTIETGENTAHNANYDWGEISENMR